VHEPDPPTDQLPLSGRHRAAPRTVRQVAVRLSAGAGAFLVVAGLGVLTADLMGLTGAAPSAAVQVHPPSAPSVRADPTFGTPLDLGATRADRAEPSPSSTEAAPPVPGSADPAPTVDAPPAPAPEPASAPPPVPASRAVAQQGEPCSAEGARGTTAAGKPVVCTARGSGGEIRWRRA
jgi:hypothetical protein